MEFSVNICEFKNIWFSNTREDTAKHFGCSKSTIDRFVKQNDLFKKKFDLPSRLNKIQHDLIIGSMLGDGSLSKLKNGKSNFIETHGEKQKDYLEWKNDILKPYSRKIVPLKPNNSSFPDGKKRVNPSNCFQCYTLYHKVFADLESFWYLRDKDQNYVLRSGKRIKCVPRDIDLSPFSFAVWFFDDGRNNPSQRNASISTDGFSFHECVFLSDLINRNFQLKTYTRPAKNKDQFEIYIPSNSYFDCMEIIENQEINCECVAYKSDVSTCEWKQFTQDKIDQIFELRESGKTYKEIAQQLETSSQYACKIYKHQKHRRS